MTNEKEFPTPNETPEIDPPGPDHLPDSPPPKGLSF